MKFTTEQEQHDRVLFQAVRKILGGWHGLTVVLSPEEAQALAMEMPETLKLAAVTEDY